MGTWFLGYVRDVDGDARGLRPHEHAVNCVELFFYRSDLAGGDLEARRVRPEQAARAFQRAVQPSGRRFEHGPIQVALRRHHAPAAPRDVRNLLLGTERVRDGGEHVYGLLIGDRQRQAELPKAQDIAEERGVADRVSACRRSHVHVHELELDAILGRTRHARYFAGINPSSSTASRSLRSSSSVAASLRWPNSPCSIPSTMLETPFSVRDGNEKIRPGSTPYSPCEQRPTE